MSVDVPKRASLSYFVLVNPILDGVNNILKKVESFYKRIEMFLLYQNVLTYLTLYSSIQSWIESITFWWPQATFCP